MKKKNVILGVLIIVTIIAISLFVVYKVDMKRMENNQPILFSTWGYDYASPVEDGELGEPESFLAESSKISFTKTYNVLNIADSIDGNYLYLTIRQFQVDEVETVKVLTSLASSVEVNKNYEFTFKYTNKKIEDNIKSIFENAMLEVINETNKTGLEQVQDEI